MAVVNDPNAGVVSRARRGGSASVSGVSIADSAPVRDITIDPLKQRIFDNSKQIIQGEFSKSIVRDEMRGKLMIEQGASMDEVRKNSPWIEKIFGQGATLHGAQAQLMVKAQDQYVLDLMENMEEYRKMTPEKFREKQIQDLDQFLTGDLATDRKIALMNSSMLAKGAQHHMKAHLPYVQEAATNAWTEGAMVKIKLAETELNNSLMSEDERAVVEKELFEGLAPQEGMNVSTYQTAISNLAVQRLQEGQAHVADLLEASGLELTAGQQIEMVKARGAWARAKELENSLHIGQQMDKLADMAATGTHSHEELMTAIMTSEAEVGSDFSYSAANVERFLRISRTAKDQKGTIDLDQERMRMWIMPSSLGQLYPENLGDMDRAAVSWYARFFEATRGQRSEDIFAKKRGFASQLVGHNYPTPILNRKLAAGFARPITANGEVNPAIGDAIELVELMRQVPGGEAYIAKNVDGDTLARMTAFQELLRSSTNGNDAGQAAMGLQQIMDNPPDVKSETYKEVRESVLDASTGGVFARMAAKMTGSDGVPLIELPVDDTAYARDIVGRNYDKYMSIYGETDMARSRALAEFEKDYTVVMGKIVPQYTSAGRLEDRMGLQGDREPTAAINAFVEHYIPESSGSKGKPFFDPSGKSVSFWQPTRDGTGDIIKTYTLADIGRWDNDQRRTTLIQNTTIERKKVYDETVPVARQWYRDTHERERQHPSQVLLSMFKEDAMPDIGVSDEEAVRLYSEFMDSDIGNAQVAVGIANELMPERGFDAVQDELGRDRKRDAKRAREAKAEAARRLNLNK